MKKNKFQLFLIVLIIFNLLSSHWRHGVDFVHASSDPGWIAANHMLPDHLIVNDLTVFGENNEHVVIGSDLGAYLSKDQGMSWEDVSRGLRHPEILCLATDASGARLYAGTRRAGVARFLPDVGNWARYSTNLPASSIHSLAVSKEYVYAGTNYEGLFRVRIGSERWEDLTQDDNNTELKDCLIEDIAVISENHIILATDKGLLVTENAGESWRYLTDFAARFRHFTTFYHYPSHSQIIAGTDGKGLIYSTDKGRSWQEANIQHPDIAQAYVQSVYFDPDVPDTWFIALDREGVYFTNDRGGTWQAMNQGLVNPRVQSMIRLPEDELSLMVGTMGSGVFKYVTAFPPEAPVWSYFIGSQAIHFEWEKPKQGTYPLGGYVIYRSSLDQPYQWKERTKVLPDTLYWIDKDVSWGETWIYGMRSFDQQEKPMYSALSEIKTVLVNDDPLIELHHPPEDYATEEEVVQLQGRVTDEGSGVQSLHLTHQTADTIHLEQTLEWDAEGHFTYALPLVLGSQEIHLVAIDYAGNSSELKRTIARKEPLRELIIRLQIGNKMATIGDRRVELPVAPQIFNNRTMVPLRFLVEAFGARVQWVAARREIQITYRDIFITLWIGETRVVIENLLDPGRPPIQKHLDVYPYLVQGTTMVPIRFISEEFDANIQWEAATQEIIIRWEP